MHRVFSLCYNVSIEGEVHCLGEKPMVKEYDEKDPSSIEHYAKRMLGKTFYEIWKENEERLDPVSRKL